MDRGGLDSGGVVAADRSDDVTSRLERVERVVRA